MKKNEKEYPKLPYIGFSFIGIGVFILLISQTKWYCLTGESLSIAFFIIMLGFAFAFPDLLKDANKGLSTMRLVAFMMINVICILLLKIGWGASSLTVIGLNASWMGVIAFVFGAKATQSFFESKMAVPDVVSPQSTASPDTADPVLQERIINIAIDQNKAVFDRPNIRGLMHGKMLQNGQLIDCITVHLKDGQKAGYPGSVTANIGQPNPVVVYVDYITDVDVPKVSGSAQNGGPIANSATAGFKGTICCRVQKNGDNKYYMLTCSHVMTNGSKHNYGGQLQTTHSASPLGTWTWAMRTDDIDAALIALQPSDHFSYHISALQNKKPRLLTSADILTTNIFMAGRDDKDHLKLMPGKVTTYSSVFPIGIGYAEGEYPINGLIVLSNIVKTGDSITYKTLSVPGDSGALIYDDQNTPLGMVIAGNSQFTYAIPLNTILSTTQSAIA
ncbi:hypothetical protein ACFGVR_06220 [Mucilaginibacter sp. AW1-3]